MLSGARHLPLVADPRLSRQWCATLFLRARIEPGRLRLLWWSGLGRFLLRVLLFRCHVLPLDQNDNPYDHLASQGEIGKLVGPEQRLHVLLVGSEVRLEVLGELPLHRPQRR
jgi:hypothetical protein